MPSSLIHLAIAKEVVKKLPLNEEEFFYGNILPDYLATKNHKKKDKLHFYEKTIVNDIIKDNVNLQKFIDTYRTELKDSVSFGVYSHFIADHFWIEQFIREHLVKENGKLYIKTKRGLIRNNRITVYVDYDRMANWMVNEYKLSQEFIRNVNYNGIFSKVYNMPKDEIYNKLNEFMSVIIEEEMDVFSKEEVSNFIKNTALQVEKRLKKIIQK